MIRRLSAFIVVGICFVLAGISLLILGPHQTLLRPVEQTQRGSSSRSALHGTSPWGAANQRRDVTSELSVEPPSPREPRRLLRIRARDAHGNSIPDFIAFVLRTETFRSPDVRKGLARLEGRPREAHALLGERYHSDDSGVAHILWSGAAFSVAISSADMYGELYVDSAPEPGVELFAELDYLDTTILRVTDQQGKPSAGTPIDLIWQLNQAPNRTPIGITDERGELGIDGAIRIVGYIISTGDNPRIGFAPAIAGCIPTVFLNSTATWPKQLELVMPSLGRLDVLLADDNMDKESLHVSLSIRAEGSNRQTTIAYPLQSGSKRGIPVALSRSYVLDVHGSDRVLFHSRFVGPSIEEDTVAIEWAPTGLMTIRAELVDSETSSPFGKRSALLRFESVDDAQYPRIELARCSSEGILSYVGDPLKLSGAKRLSVRFDDGVIFESVPFNAREGTVELGKLLSLKTMPIGDVIVVDATGAAIPDARLSPNRLEVGEVCIYRSQDRFSVSATRAVTEVILTAHAPGFVRKSIRVRPGSGDSTVQLVRSGSMTVRVLVDDGIEPSMLGATLTKRSQAEGSQWGRPIRTESDQLGWSWQKLTPGVYDLWLLGMKPPIPLHHESVEVLTGSEEVTIDLRSRVGVAQIRVNSPSTPVTVMNGDPSSSTYLCGTTLPPEGGSLLLPGSQRLIFVRDGARITELIIVQGESTTIDLADALLLLIEIDSSLKGTMKIHLEPVGGSLGPDTPCQIWASRSRRPTTMGTLTGTASELSPQRAQLSFTGTFRVSARSTDGALGRVEPSFLQIREGTHLPTIRIIRQ